MKTLTLTDICCYRDLKYLNTKSGNIFHSTGAYDSIDGNLIVTDGEHHKSIDIWPLKPIVRPLNLTTPITHKGETFVPIDRLNEIDEEYKVMYDSENNCVVFYDLCDLNLFEQSRLEAIKEEMRKMMFDYNGLIESGLAVSVDTLDNDPYTV